MKTAVGRIVRYAVDFATALLIVISFNIITEVFHEFHSFG